jgi:hypothetical protein
VTPASAASSVAGQRLAAHQRDQHVRTGWIADQRSDSRDIRAVFHTSAIAEACDQGER